jgi:Telomere regulation protein Stn1
VYFYLNHPIQWVQVAGLVVDFEPNDQYWLFHVDDGSGALIEVVLPRRKAEKVPLAKSGEQITFLSPQSLGISVLGNEIDLSSIEIGVTVKVKGGIREFRSVKQIALERLCMC